MAWEFGGNDEWYRQRDLRRGGRRSHFAAANEALRKFRDMVGQPGTPQAAIARSDNALQNLDPETLTYTDPEGTRYSAGSLGERRAARLGTNDLSTYQTPSGGTASVQSGTRVPYYSQGTGQSYFPAANLSTFASRSDPYQSASLRGTTSQQIYGNLGQFTFPSGGTAIARSKIFSQPNGNSDIYQPRRYFDF